MAQDGRERGRLPKTFQDFEVTRKAESRLFFSKNKKTSILAIEDKRLD